MSRFGKALYLSDSVGLALQEVATKSKLYSNPTHYLEVSVNFTGKKVLDLTDAQVAARWGYTGGAATDATRRIGADALAQGYVSIIYRSERGRGVNYAILKDFEEVLRFENIQLLPPN